MDYETKFGRIPDGAFVFMFSGWGSGWPVAEELFGSKTPANDKTLHFPSFHRDSVEFLIKQRNIRGVGVDTPSTDYGQQHNVDERPEGTHRVLAENNRIGLEFVANLEKMPSTGAWVILMPMKIAGGSGAPTRVVGLLPDANEDIKKTGMFSPSASL